MEAESQLETIRVYNSCRKQLINDVRKRKLEVQGEDPWELPTKRRKSSCRQTEIKFYCKKRYFVCAGICDKFSDKGSLFHVKRKGKPEITRTRFWNLLLTKMMSFPSLFIEGYLIVQIFLLLRKIPYCLVEKAWYFLNRLPIWIYQKATK